MTRAEKRVAIAKDVIKQIKAGRYGLRTGVYIASDGDIEIDRYDQKVVKRLKRCDVCAIGSAIASGMRLFNKCNLDVSACGDEALRAVRKWFSPSQAIAIEIAFEGHYGEQGYGQGYGIYGMQSGHFATTKEHVLNKAALEFFSCRSGDPELRAIAIFQNIVDNNGTFKP